VIGEFCRRQMVRSLWLFHANCGACNGCDIEVIDCLTPYYDVERFGMRLVGSPRHADALVVSGSVSRQVAPALRRLYEATPSPKVVLAVGTCAVGGNIWHDTYNILGGADKVVPVNAYIPGCPPRPEAILFGALVALGKAQPKVVPQHEAHLPPGFDAEARLRAPGAPAPAGAGGEGDRC